MENKILRIQEMLASIRPHVCKTPLLQALDEQLFLLLLLESLFQGSPKMLTNFTKDTVNLLKAICTHHLVLPRKITQYLPVQTSYGLAVLSRGV